MFEKLKKLWNPISEETSNSRQSNEEKLQEAPSIKPVGSSFELRKELLGKIVKNDFFRPFWDSDKIAYTFVLWITPDKPAYQIEAGKKDFRDALHKEFDNADLKAIGMASWQIETKLLPEDATFIEIEAGIYLEIRSEIGILPDPFKDIPTKAKISIVEGSGSLEQHEYLLDANDRQTYQIGRGNSDNAGRKNYIVIRDNENDLLYKNNRYVSSSHAELIFVENKGFCLKSLNRNNRTIVYRDEIRVADIKDLYSKFGPLQNGDRIELGKKVSLKFEIG